MVRNELVETTVATKTNGNTARKGIELSSRAAHLAVGGAGLGSRRSTTPSAACSWRSRTGQGEMPRRARHTLAGRLAAGQPLCASHLPTEAGIRHSGALLVLENLSGIRATTVMFTVINSVLLRPLCFYPEPEKTSPLCADTRNSSANSGDSRILISRTRSTKAARSPWRRGVIAGARSASRETRSTCSAERSRRSCSRRWEFHRCKVALFGRTKTGRAQHPW